VWWEHQFALLVQPGQNPVSNYWHKLVGPDPFRGLYHLNSFDLAVMIPYFLVLGVLAMYGLHRYWLVFHFFKYKNNLPGPPPEIARGSASLTTGWPKVTIQLPIFNERYVIDRLVDAVVKFDYPRELMQIQVLDDSTDETCDIARACVERHQAMGVPIEYLHRTNRTGFKAGALEAGLQTATGEFVAIFDADFLPAADFLRRTLPYFLAPSALAADPAKIGMVQARWTYLNSHYSKLTEIESILLDGHFVIEHGARSRRGTFFNFNGTAGVWRRAAIEDAGGWQHDTLTEDTDLSYRAQLRGWKFLYLPDIECVSELPVEMNAFKAQQARWAKGLIQVAKKILPQMFRSKQPWHIKAETFFHLTANISYPLMIVLSTMLLPAMIVRFYQGWFQMLVIDLPLFLASTCSISSFYLVAQRTLHPQSWKRTFLYLPFVMALGIGIAVRNALAVLEALAGKQSEFVRTPKYRIEEKKDNWAKKAYRKPSGLLPYLEVLLGLYFALTVVYAIQNENYATVPFLLLFVWGYLYTGLMSLGQGYFERLRFKVEPAEELTPRAAAGGAPSF
jgi:cellulose synthase/poly-beta-1,6-N-acetylglucosamine synthase-like glycosyltransferase